MGDKRLDVLLVERGLAPSRARARSLLEAGVVRLDGRAVHKPSTPCHESCELRLEGVDHDYVSRGGLKLEGALDDLGVDPGGKVVADFGASTGGFTDCVLQRGATRVYAIDVGTAQLHARLRADPRVVSLEGVNARHLAQGSLPEPVDLVVIDASFIGLSKLLPAARAVLREGGEVLALVKPQFEVGAAHVGKRGVVRDARQRARALEDVKAAAAALGFAVRGDAECRIPGPEGNRESFLLLAAG